MIRIFMRRMGLASILFLCILQTSAFGQGSGSDPGRWQFEFTPYFQLVAVDADTTVDGQTVGLDIDFDEIIDNFDVFGLSGRFEAWNKPWGLILDAQYTDLDGDFDLVTPGPTFEVGVDIEQSIVDLAGAKRFAEGKWWFDAIGGLRYTYLKQKIGIGTALPPLNPTLGGSEDWIEPLIGGRVGFQSTDRLAFMVRGDASGFGIGTASDLTWNLLAGLDYRFGKSTSFKLAYQIYDLDYDRSSGNERFGFDGQLSGPKLGVTFRF